MSYGQGGYGGWGGQAAWPQQQAGGGWGQQAQQAYAQQQAQQQQQQQQQQAMGYGYGQAQQQQQQQAQQQGGWGAGWGGGGQKGAAGGGGQQGAAGGLAATLTVTGCTHGTVGPIVRGTYHRAGDNHGKPTFKKDAQVNGLDVQMYYWDERDGPGFCGWWFGPKVGGDQVWAFHADRAAAPPSTGWKVPYDGPVDTSLVISSKAGGGAAAPQQAAQQQMGKGQQGQWQGQQQQMQQQDFQKKRLEEQKRLQEQRAQMEQMKAKQQMEMKQRAQMEQKAKLEENRKRLEEANKKRIEDQKARMELLKKQQEELAKKKEIELAKKKEEQRACLEIRKVCTKLKNCKPDVYEEVKKELEEVLAKELEACGVQKERMGTEGKQTLEAVELKMKQIEEARKKQEEMKAAEDKRRRELLAKAQELIAQFAKLVEAVETACKDLNEEADPFNDKEKKMSLNEINAAGGAVESAVKAADEATKVCTEFLRDHGKEMKNTPPIQGEESTVKAQQEMQKLTLAFNDKKNEIVKVSRFANQQKEFRVRQAEAELEFGKLMSVFSKYGKDGIMTKKDIQSYAKGEHKFTIPLDSLEVILRALVADGSKGVKKDDFQRLKAAVGLAREKALDAKRKEAREAREAEIAKLKAELEAGIKKAADAVESAKEEVAKVEKHVGPLPSKAKTLKAVEMIAAADEADEMAKVTQTSLKDAKEQVEGLKSDEVEAELKVFLKSEIAKLEKQIVSLEARLTKMTTVAAKFRTDASKKNAVELEQLRKKALGMIRYHQVEKSLKKEQMFEAIDSNKDGQIEESEFVAFFKSCLKEKIPVKEKKAETENGDEKKEEIEEVEVTIEPADLSRLFEYLCSDEETAIAKDVFLAYIARFMKVIKETVVTQTFEINKDGKSLRRLEVGEVVEVIEGPVVEKEMEVKRLFVHVMKDDIEGWITPVGNQGTTFLVDGGNEFKVVKETILTNFFAISGGKEETRKVKDTTRKLKEGEIVEVREWAKKEESCGLMRMKVRVKSDGQIGWATTVGNTGTVFLQVV